MWTVRASFVVVVSLLGLGAQLAWPYALEAAPASQDALHEVVPGDNLHLIAGYYYGDARQWERIWQANRDQIPNPNRIERGTLLRIPDAAPPDESYADFLSRAGRVVTPVGAPTGPPAKQP